MRPTVVWWGKGKRKLVSFGDSMELQSRCPCVNFRLFWRIGMQVTLPLDRMTTLEKLRVIEEVWDDLCRSKEDIPSPSWHADVLRLREEQVRSGESTFLELNEAKRVLRERLT